MTDAPPVSPLPPPSVARRLHSGISAARYWSMHFLGALFPFGAGVALYGWRAALAVLTVVASTVLSVAIWRRIGARGRQLSLSQGAWFGMLLGLMLPAQLATSLRLPFGGPPPWPLLVAAGLLLAILLWLLGGLAGAPVHPAVVAAVLLHLGFAAYLEPNWVLDRDHLVVGDVLSATPTPAGEISPDPWLRRRAAGPRQQAFWGEPPARALADYTTGRLRPDRGQIALHALLRDRMPPLEDLAIGGQPAGVGLGSTIAVIIGGLFLLYRGLIDYRIPLVVTAAAFVALLVLPVPTVIREDGAHFRWLAMRSADVRWETAVTFANYELMASPTPFVAFFLATAAPIRPLGRRAKVCYAAAVGAMCAVGQLYVSAAFGPYLAVLAGGFLSPVLDRFFKPRPLV